MEDVSIYELYTKQRSGADDLSLPKATVQKIINEILSTPGDTEHSISFGKDARDLLIDCCVEFITLISSEANEIAEREAKKTIATEHIDKALRELGFPEYVREVLASAGEMKESLKVSLSWWERGEERVKSGCFWAAVANADDRLGRRRRVKWIRAG